MMSLNMFLDSENDFPDLLPAEREVGLSLPPRRLSPPAPKPSHQVRMDMGTSPTLFMLHLCCLLFTTFED
jgi:hypothetical protein